MIRDLQNILMLTVATALTAGATTTLSGCSDSASDTKSDAGAEAGCPAGCPAADGGAEAGCPAGCPASDGGAEAGCPAGCPAATAGDENTPPTGTAASIDAWLAKGDYTKGTWKCEAAPRSEMPTGASPHAKVRVCSNAKASAYASGTFPVGAATVKELYKADGTTRDGTAISHKVAAGTGGETWYWYEKQGGAEIANSVNNRICVGCHSKAGASPNPGGDYTFTIVK